MADKQPSEKELKRIHGDDVELAPDDSEDNHLTEAQALAQAKKQGIEFVDEWHVAAVGSTQPIMQDNQPLTFPTQAKAEKALAELDGADDYQIVQSRHQAN